VDSRHTDCKPDAAQVSVEPLMTVTDRPKNHEAQGVQLPNNQSITNQYYRVGQKVNLNVFALITLLVITMYRVKQ